MADEKKFLIRTSKDGKLYQVIRPDGGTRPHFLSVDKFDLPVPVEAIRYGKDPHRTAHRAGAFIFGKYWRRFVAIADVVIAQRGDTTEENVDETDPRVAEFFTVAAPVRVEDAARALAVDRRNKAEAAAEAPAPAAKPAPQAKASASSAQS